MPRLLRDLPQPLALIFAHQPDFGYCEFLDGEHGDGLVEQGTMMREG